MLTRFEVARIISARALQIGMGAPVLLKSPKSTRSLEIAEQEFEEHLIPLTVVRIDNHGKEVVVN